MLSSSDETVKKNHLEKIGTLGRLTHPADVLGMLTHGLLTGNAHINHQS